MAFSRPLRVFLMLLLAALVSAQSQDPAGQVFGEQTVNRELHFWYPWTYHHNRLSNTRQNKQRAVNSSHKQPYSEAS